MTLSTAHLILCPQKHDYGAWYTGFAERLPSQYKYDACFLDNLLECDGQWFSELMPTPSKASIGSSGRSDR